MGNSLIGFLSKSLVFVSKRGIHSWKRVALLSWATGVNRSRSLFCKSDWGKSNGSDSLLVIKRRENCEKLSKAYEKYVFSKRSARFLRAICLNHEQITGITLFLRNWERFAHSRSFVMSDLSKLLTFALLLGVTRVICSLNNMSNFEWKSEFWTLVLIEEKAYL